MNVGAENFRGWTGMPVLKDADSGDSSLHAPHSSLEEEVPENLGNEWVM